MKGVIPVITWFPFTECIPSRFTQVIQRRLRSSELETHVIRERVARGLSRMATGGLGSRWRTDLFPFNSKSNTLAPTWLPFLCPWLVRGHFLHGTIQSQPRKRSERCCVSVSAAARGRPGCDKHRCWHRSDLALKSQNTQRAARRPSFHCPGAFCSRLFEMDTARWKPGPD